MDYYQDGADFYNAANDEHVWTYPGRVRDWNVDDAFKASEAFEAHAKKELGVKAWRLNIF